MACEHCGAKLKSYRPVYYTSPQEDAGIGVEGPAHTPARCRDLLREKLGRAVMALQCIRIRIDQQEATTEVEARFQSDLDEHARVGLGAST